MSRPITDMIGRTFGRWTVVKMVAHVPYQKVSWLCRCECGAEKVVRVDQLTRGVSKSCGCLAREITRERARKHGYTPRDGNPRIPEYEVWKQMNARCRNANNPRYRRYGGRGITVCQAWIESFEAFLRDMGPRPSDKHSIDRIDNDGNYCLENCRWATERQQRLNTCRVVLIEHDGVIDSIGGWSRRTGISQSAIRSRLRKGWQVENVLAKGRQTAWSRLRKREIA